jgi:outer membrane protein TolC
MGNDVRLDTTQVVNYKNRIEYQALQTQKRLQIDNLDYYKLSFLPTLSVFYNYNLAYLNNDFNKLYNTSYPNSLIGLQVTLPLFEGTKRIQNIKVAKLELERSDWDITAIKFQINTQFVQAMSAYKSNLNYWRILKKNVQTAQNVYNVISLQYKQGVKTYLDVITAESDLRTAEFNYLDALFNVLSSKVDVEKAMGKIPLNQ